MEECIVANNLTKSYGKKTVLEDMNLELERGKIYGLIGRNGAGKTTLLSCLSAQSPISGGNVTVNGMPVWENREALSHICFSREISPIRGGGDANTFRVRDYLRCGSWFYPHWDQALAEKLVKEFDLDLKKRINKLSKGMLSMLTIVIALSSKADYTFLDEPVAGLDVVMREYFYRILLEEFENTGRTFVISTHIIEEAADVFEEVIILDDGKIRIKENTQKLLDRAVQVNGGAEDVERIVGTRQPLRKETVGRSMGASLLLAEGDKLPEDPAVSRQPMSLQQVFVAMCGKGEGAV